MLISDMQVDRKSILFYGIDSLNGNVQLSIRLKIFEALDRFGARIGHSFFSSY